MSERPPARARSETTQPVALQETHLAPTSVALSRWVANPRAIIRGDAPAVMDSRRGTSQLIVDFGRETVGSVSVTAEALADTTVKLYYGEDIVEAARTEEFSADWYKLPRDEFTLAVGPCTVKSRGRRAFRYVHVLIPRNHGRLAVSNITAALVHYPVERRGWFSCSDPLLNRIWRAAEHTTLLCMQQYYEDGIKRDGLLWIGDYRVQYLCNALLFGDAALARKCLCIIASTQRENGSLDACAAAGGGHQHPFNIDYMPTIPRAVSGWGLINYSADFIGCVKEYHDFTGDLQTVSDLWPCIRRLLTYLRGVQFNDQLSTGFLTDCPTYNQSFWRSAGTLAMQLYEAVSHAAELSLLVGDDAAGQQCRAFLATHKERIISTFYSPSRRIFLDEADPARGTSWHVNAFSIISGITSGAAEAADLLKRLEVQNDARRPCAGFMKFWVLTARYRAGMAREALDDIREYWGYMLGHDATTFWDLCDPSVEEGIDHSLPHALSQCHGWAAGPCYLFPAFLLGLQPAEPGLARVTVRPQLGDLEWAEGVIPTPHGDIAIHWEASPRLNGYVTLPPGISGEAVVAFADGEKSFALHGGENRIHQARRR